MIHERYGYLDHDYRILSSILAKYKVSSILDVGCGSGRLFELYAQNDVNEVFGIDISAQALAIAKQRYPNIYTIHGKI